jgi:hypothetical protein
VPKEIPNEIVVAKLAIQAAQVALESLFERIRVVPRSEKVIVSETVREACLRLDAARALLARLEAIEPETVPSTDDSD